MGSSSEKIIQSYLPMVDFIADLYGENCEVLLHDLSDLEHSIVAIRNNHITGRNVNDGITDFALKIINNQEKYKDKDFITNYMGKTKDGSKILRSSTYFIRDEKGKLISMLCVNVDITALKEARKVIEKLMILDGNDKKGEDKEIHTENDDKSEKFFSNLEELVNNKISEILNRFNIEPTRMVKEEKKQVVKALKEEGVFLIKGSVNEIASQLEVSVQTIYRYLNELEN